MSSTGINNNQILLFSFEFFYTLLCNHSRICLSITSIKRNLSFCCILFQLIKSTYRAQNKIQGQCSQKIHPMSNILPWSSNSHFPRSLGQFNSITLMYKERTCVSTRSLQALKSAWDAMNFALLGWSFLWVFASWKQQKDLISNSRFLCSPCRIWEGYATIIRQIDKLILQNFSSHPNTNF